MRSSPRDTRDGDRSIRSALKEAAHEAQRRRRLGRWALIVLAGALLLLCLLLVGNPV